jgi:anthranilate synthase component I
MKKYFFDTSCKKMLADVFTPISIYLRLRDRFPGSILLEGADFHAAQNSWSFICVHPISGIEITSNKVFEFKYPGEPVVRQNLTNPDDVLNALGNFMQSFEPAAPAELPAAQSLFGYTTYDAVQFFDTIRLKPAADTATPSIPLMRYRLYKYVIAVNHFKDELYLCENRFKGMDSELDVIENLICSKHLPEYPFKAEGEETSTMSDAAYMAMVEKGIAHCLRGDVFQVVLSRAFSRKYSGDEFNVYRALRRINPSPYLFYFDYNDYKLMGSSPESQLIVQKNKAVVHPIAGTFMRTGDDATDAALAEKLLNDEKENAEHVMLVDLARNDLSRYAGDVAVSSYKQIQYYSHVIHMVSEVTGTPQPGCHPFRLLASVFPAGTLSGAPKFRAMELIDTYEASPRGFYGGAIGMIGFNGDVNHAIMIRSFLCRSNTLHYRAGAGIVARSQPASELDEVRNKLNALRQAVEQAQEIGR